jgi:hypothetical protein
MKGWWYRHVLNVEHQLIFLNMLKTLKVLKYLLILFHQHVSNLCVKIREMVWLLPLFCKASAQRIFRDLKLKDNMSSSLERRQMPVKKTHVGRQEERLPCLRPLVRPPPEYFMGGGEWSHSAATTRTAILRRMTLLSSTPQRKK